MQNLANVVLDYFWFLHFSEPDEMDALRAIKLLELFNRIENNWSEEEKQSLISAAALRLQQQQTADDEDDPIRFMTLEQKGFLECLARRNFDFAFLDNAEEPIENLEECAE